MKKRGTIKVFPILPEPRRAATVKKEKKKRSLPLEFFFFLLFLVLWFFKTYPSHSIDTESLLEMLLKAEEKADGLLERL